MKISKAKLTWEFNRLYTLYIVYSIYGRYKRMDDEIKMMLNTILDEMGRMEDRINKRFDAVDERFNKIGAHLETMQHEINACKLERESIGLLIKKID